MKRLIRFLIPFALVCAATLPAAAFALEAKPLRVVLVPERNVFEQQRRYKVLSDYASRRLPFEITFEVVGSYREALDQVRKGEADGSFMGSLVAAYGMETFALVPTVRPQWLSGESHYRGVVFKRVDSPVTSDVRSWRGHSIVFSSPLTSAGYFYPLSLLRAAGVSEPVETFFAGTSFSGSHDATIWMVTKGMAEIGASKSTVYDEYLEKRPEEARQLEELARGGRYPDMSLMLNPSVPAARMETVRGMFLTMAQDPAGLAALKTYGAIRFVETGRADFLEVFEVVRAAGFRIKDLAIVEAGREPAR